MGLPGNIRVNNSMGDFYPTPPNIVEDILRREKLVGSILEPACGDGTMIRVLRRYYPESLIGGFDLYPRTPGIRRMDFMSYKKEWDNIITNPPYNQFLPFLMHSLELAKDKVIMIFPLTYLSGKSRYKEVYSKNPPARVYVYTYRVCMNPGEGAKNRIDFCWGVWEKGESQTQLKWINKEV